MSKYENLLESGSGNVIQSFFDNFLKSNGDFRSKAGFRMTVIRESMGVCCAWCQDLVGVYDYDNRPADVYARHKNCNCIVVTKTERGTYQDAWSRKEYDAEREARTARIRELEARGVTINPEALETKIDLENGQFIKKANSIKEAKDILKKEIGLDAGGFYEKVNIDVANAVNNEIGKCFEVFGDLHAKGTLDGVRILKTNKEFYAAYSPPLKEIHFKQQTVQYKNSLAKMKQDAIIEYRAGNWSTASEMHSIRHELGHAVEKTLTSQQLSDIEQIRINTMQKLGIQEVDVSNPNKADMLVAGTELSYYGLKSTGEFIAESVAEYLNGHARTVAQSVVNIILR